MLSAYFTENILWLHYHVSVIEGGAVDDADNPVAKDSCTPIGCRLREGIPLTPAPLPIAPRNLGEALARSMREAGFEASARLFDDITSRHRVPPKMASAFGAYAAYWGQADAAERAYALAVEPGASPEMLMNRGLARLRLGDWRDGWGDMEHRLEALRLTPFAELRGKESGRSVERWRRGEPVPEELLVFPEQGLGDTLQFARFLPDLVRRGVAVTVVGRPYLEPAIASLSNAPDFSPLGRPLTSRAGRWCCLMSLPALLGLDHEADLVRPPYLFQDLAPAGDRRPGPLRVGLSWQGNPDHPHDARRSAPLAAFAPLLSMPHLQVVSLQIGPGAAQIAATPQAARMLTPLDDSASLTDTARVIADLDLVVSVDTAVAHLAGGMGRRTALLLAAASVDWRWRRGGGATLWYGQTEVFQQAALGDWSAPVAGALNLARAMRERLQQPVAGR